MNQRSKLAAAAAAGAPADDGEVREGAARRRRAPGVRTLVGGQRWWLAAVFGRLWPSTRVLVGAGLRGEREGGGIRWRRWGFGNGAFARLLCLCVCDCVPKLGHLSLQSCVFAGAMPQNGGISRRDA